MGLLVVFWGPALISLLVCLLPSLMSLLLPLWFPPPLKNLSSSLCLRTVNPLAWITIAQLPSHQQSWRFLRDFKKHICSSIPVTLDPLQFAYRPNRSTDDAISQVLHSSLTHIDSKNGNYVRLLFIDYSSAFNTIVPTKLAVKLSDLGLNTSLCDWIQDFLTGRPQVVKMGQFTSNSITLNIGAPQGCVLSPAHIQTQVNKARQRLYHLRQLRKFRVSPAILKTFYSGAIESVLTQRISVWYSNATNQDCKALQRVVRLAERISGSALPSLQDIYLKRSKSRAVKIIKDLNHPGNHLFILLPSGKRFRSMMAKTERLRRSFFPQAPKLKLGLITFTFIWLNLMCTYPVQSCLHILLAHSSCCLHIPLHIPVYIIIY